MANIIVVTNQLGSFATNCYTVVNTDTREAVIIDPAANAEYILKMIKSQSYKLKAIFITHGHWDHVGAVNAIKEALPEVKIYAGVKEKELLSNCASNLSAMFSDPYFVKADIYVDDDEEIEILGTKVRCLWVPGHTIGSISYYFTENSMVFDGDTLFAGSIGRSDFPTGDEKTLLSKIEEKLFSLPEDTVVYPGHNSRTTIKREKSSNMFFV